MTSLLGETVLLQLNEGEYIPVLVSKAWVEDERPCINGLGVLPDGGKTFVRGAKAGTAVGEFQARDARRGKSPDG